MDRSECPARISVIIVTYNGRALLAKCLAALEAQTRLPDETIVVDNGSTDDTVACVTARFPWVRVIESPENLGFAGGNNVGIRASDGEIVVLLNNDTVPAPGFISDIVAPIERDARIGSVAGTLVFAEAPDRVASAGITVYQNGLALDHAIGEEWVKRPRQAKIFGASAGASAYRRAALDEAGLFSDQFFMYLEDVDLAWRLRHAGWECVSVRNALVHHVYSASEGQAPSAKDYLMARNRVRTLLRCWPAVAWRHFWWRVVLYELGALAFAIGTRNWRSMRGRLAGWLEIRGLLNERRRAQAARSPDDSRLVYWLQPSPGSREHLRIRQEIRRYAANRPPT